MAELTQIYIPNDGQEFLGQNGITKHNFTHVINTENVQQDGREETQIFYRMTAGILKTKRQETYYRTQFIHGINTTCCNCEFFEKLILPLAEAARENFSFSKNSLTQIDSKLNSKPYDYLHIMPSNM